MEHNEFWALNRKTDQNPKKFWAACTSEREMVDGREASTHPLRVRRSARILGQRGHSGKWGGHVKVLAITVVVGTHIVFSAVESGLQTVSKKGQQTQKRSKQLRKPQKLF